jgi:hypothetical protein
MAAEARRLRMHKLSEHCDILGDWAEFIGGIFQRVSLSSYNKNLYVVDIRKN